MGVGRYLGAAWTAAALSGIPSGVSALLGRSAPIAATREIGRFFTDRPSLVAGGVAHGVLSTVFAWPAPLIGRSRHPLLLGGVYGLALYGVNFHVVAPRLWAEILEYDDLAQVGDHVAYGVVLGAVARRRPATRSHSAGT